MSDTIQEIQRYKRIYREVPNYRMGIERMAASVKLLNAFPPKQQVSYLDVGCGRGEMLWMADALGWLAVYGIDPAIKVANLPSSSFMLHCSATNLPLRDDQFSLVSCFDVLEHLLPEDAEAACREMFRVAHHQVLITLNNEPCGRGPRFRRKYGELHINRMPYDDWGRLFRSLAAERGMTVEYLPPCYKSAAWRIAK